MGFRPSCKSLACLGIDDCVLSNVVNEIIANRIELSRASVPGCVGGRNGRPGYVAVYDRGPGLTIRSPGVVQSLARAGPVPWDDMTPIQRHGVTSWHVNTPGPPLTTCTPLTDGEPPTPCELIW